MRDDADENGKPATDEPKPDHEPPKGAETTATWSGGERFVRYTVVGVVNEASRVVFLRNHP